MTCFQPIVDFATSRESNLSKIRGLDARGESGRTNRTITWRLRQKGRGEKMGEGERPEDNGRRRDATRRWSVRDRAGPESSKMGQYDEKIKK